MDGSTNRSHSAGPKVSPAVERRETSGEAEESNHETAPRPRWFGRFQLIEQIGRGGFGTVFRPTIRFLSEKSR